MSHLRGYEPVNNPIFLSVNPGNVTDTNGTEPTTVTLKGSLPMDSGFPALAYANLELFLLLLTKQFVIPELPGAMENVAQELAGRNILILKSLEGS